MDQLKEYLKDTDYNLVDATSLNIYEIQDRLKQCRVDDNLVIFVEKRDQSQEFFDRLGYFKLDTQYSNYYIAHSRNYAVWVDPSELNKEELLEFLNESKSSIKIDEDFFGEYSNRTDRAV
jgi:hypothetical protein